MFLNIKKTPYVVTNRTGNETKLYEGSFLHESKKLNDKFLKRS